MSCVDVPQVPAEQQEPAQAEGGEANAEMEGEPKADNNNDDKKDDAAGNGGGDAAGGEGGQGSSLL